MRSTRPAEPGLTEKELLELVGENSGVTECMLRLLLDEMFDAKVSEQLRNRSHDVYGIVEHANLRTMTDTDVLELATVEGRVLVTLNIADLQLLDRQWASRGRTHTGLVFISTTKYRPNRNLIGIIVTALDQRAKNDALPRPGALTFR